MIVTCSSLDFINLMDICCCVVFFFKQKTAYEMRISDWSSDVCSSDLAVLRTGDHVGFLLTARPGAVPAARSATAQTVLIALGGALLGGLLLNIMPCVFQIGRASCRERVCQ